MLFLFACLIINNNFYCCRCRSNELVSLQFNN